MQHEKITQSEKLEKFQQFLDVLKLAYEGNFEDIVGDNANDEASFSKLLGELEKVAKAFFVESERQKILLDEKVFKQTSSDLFGKIILITGPSGAGKDTLVDRFVSLHSRENVKMVMATSRKPRQGELEAVNYHFITKQQFHFITGCRLFLDTNGFVENLYGVPKFELEKRIGRKSLILNTGPDTVRKLRQIIPGIKTILVLPPSDEEHFRRLVNRGAESEEEIIKRIRADKNNFSNFAAISDYTIISEVDGIDKALEEMKKIISG